MYFLNFESDKYQGLYVGINFASDGSFAVYLCQKSGDVGDIICCKVELYTVSSAMAYADWLQVPIKVSG